MLNTNNIRKLLSNTTQDIDLNIIKIRKVFLGGLEYIDDDNQSLLHILVDNKYNEKMFISNSITFKNAI